MLVQQVMTPADTTVRPEASVFEALELLRSLEIRVLPVVDGRNVLVGVLTDRELARAPRGQAHNAHVADLMARDGIFTFAGADVRDPARRMAEWRVGAVPVIDRAGALVGMVSYADVLRAMLEPAA